MVLYTFSWYLHLEGFFLVRKTIPNKQPLPPKKHKQKSKIPVHYSLKANEQLGFLPFNDV